MAATHSWLFAAASIVFWTLLWPLALVWLALWSIDRQWALDRGAVARRERRVQRLLRWYPAEWREHHGVEMAALLTDTIDDGHGGPRLTLNVAREGVAERAAPPVRREALAWACLGFCAIPLIPQGIVPAIMKLTETPTRSWFLALYVPAAYQWLLVATMMILGLAMLGTGVKLTMTKEAPLPG